MSSTRVGGRTLSRVVVDAFLWERERERMPSLRKERSFAEVDGTFSKAASLHRNRGRYSTWLGRTVRILGIRTIGFGQKFRGKVQQLCGGHTIRILTVCAAAKRDSPYSKRTACTPRQRGTVFKVHLLHINSYSKHKKRGHDFRGSLYRIYCWDSYTQYGFLAQFSRSCILEIFLRRFAQIFLR